MAAKRIWREYFSICPGSTIPSNEGSHHIAFWKTRVSAYASLFFLKFLSWREDEMHRQNAGGEKLCGHSCADFSAGCMHDFPDGVGAGCGAGGKAHCLRAGGGR